MTRRQIVMLALLSVLAFTGSSCRLEVHGHWWWQGTCEAEACCIQNLSDQNADHSADFQTCLDSAAEKDATVYIPPDTTIRTSRPLFLYGKASIEGDDRDTSVIELGGGCFDAAAFAAFDDVEVTKGDGVVFGKCDGKGSKPAGTPCEKLSDCGPMGDCLYGTPKLSPQDYFQPYWINLGHSGAKVDTLLLSLPSNAPPGTKRGQEILPNESVRWSGRLKNLTLRLTEGAEPNLGSVIWLHYAHNFAIENIVVDQRAVAELANNAIGASPSRWTTWHQGEFDFRRQQIVGGTIVGNIILAKNTGIEIDVMPDQVAGRLRYATDGGQWSYVPEHDPKLLAKPNLEAAKKKLCEAWVTGYAECKAKGKLGWLLEEFCPRPPTPSDDPENCANTAEVWTIEQGCKLRRNLGGAGGLNVAYFSGGCDGKGGAAADGTPALGGTSCTCSNDYPCENDDKCGPGGMCQETWKIEGNCIDGIADDGISMKGSRGGTVVGNTVRATRGQIDATALEHFGSREIVFKRNYVERIWGDLDKRWANPAVYKLLHVTPESQRSGVNENIDFHCNFAYMPGKRGRSRPANPNRARGGFMEVSGVDGTEIHDNVFVDDTVAQGECALEDKFPFKKCGPAVGLAADCHDHAGCRTVPGCGSTAICREERECVADARPNDAAIPSAGPSRCQAGDCTGNKEYCLARPAIELWASSSNMGQNVPFWPGLHPQCFGRCTGGNIFIACPDPNVPCPPGSACQHREACHKDKNACGVSLLYGGTASQRTCPDEIRSTRGTSVSVKGNVLTGEGIQCGDPLVTMPKRKEAWLSYGQSLEEQLENAGIPAPDVAAITPSIDVGKVPAIPATPGDCADSQDPFPNPQDDNAVVPSRGVAQALKYWRARIAAPRDTQPTTCNEPATGDAKELVTAPMTGAARCEELIACGDSYPYCGGHCERFGKTIGTCIRDIPPWSDEARCVCKWWP